MAPDAEQFTQISWNCHTFYRLIPCCLVSNGILNEFAAFTARSTVSTEAVDGDFTQ